MKLEYIVVGLREEGSNIRLFLEPVVKKTKMDNISLLNPSGMISAIQNQMLQQIPDSVSIPSSEFDNEKFGYRKQVSMNLG